MSELRNSEMNDDDSVEVQRHENSLSASKPMPKLRFAKPLPDKEIIAQEYLKRMQERAEIYGKIKENFERKNDLIRIRNQIRIDAFENEKELPFTVRYTLRSNINGRVNARPVLLTTEMKKIITNNLVQIINAHPASAEDITLALDVPLEFSENQLCDHLQDGSFGLASVIHEMQYPQQNL